MSTSSAVLRTAAELTRFFDNTELLEPAWSHSPNGDPILEPSADHEIGFFCGVGRKP